MAGYIYVLDDGLLLPFHFGALWLDFVHGVFHVLENFIDLLHELDLNVNGNGSGNFLDDSAIFKVQNLQVDGGEELVSLVAVILVGEFAIEHPTLHQHYRIYYNLNPEHRRT